MKKYFLLGGGVGVAIVAGSFVLGLVVAGGSESTTNIVSPRSSDSEVLASSVSGTPPIARTQNSLQSVEELAALDGFYSHFERTVALHELIEGASTEDLLAHLKRSSSLGNSLREEIQLAIIQRIAAKDPMVALDAVSEHQSDQDHVLLSAVYREWAVLDLNQAIEHARSLDLDAKKAIVQSMLLAREDLPPLQRREMARQLDIEWLAIEVLDRNSDSPTIQDPEQEWTAFVDRNSENLGSPDETQRRMMTHIGSAWVLRDGVNAIDNLIESLSTQTAKGKISELVARQVAESDPRLAFDLAIHVRSLGVIGTTSLVMSQWSRVDPLSALNAVSTLEAKYLRGKLQTDVLQMWANTDPKSLLNQANDLADQLQSVARTQAILSLAYRSPQEAAEYVGQIEKQEDLDQVARAVAINWSTSDISGALQWIENEASIAHNRDVLRTAAISGLARSDPQQAMQVALAQPVNEDGVGPEAEVIDAIKFQDMDTAVSLLPQVRAGKTSLEAYESVIRFLTPPISNEADRAIDLFVQLSNEQEIPRDSFLITSLVLNEPRALFDALERFDSTDFKRRVASSLLRFHANDDTFTQEQISVLQETRQYEQESREARRDAAMERMTELIREAQSTEESDPE